MVNEINFFLITAYSRQLPIYQSIVCNYTANLYYIICINITIQQVMHIKLFNFKCNSYYYSHTIRFYIIIYNTQWDGVHIPLRRGRI